MVCRRCGGRPPTPYRRPGLPTITAWGPFPDHELVTDEQVEPDVGLDYGSVQKEGE